MAKGKGNRNVNNNGHDSGFGEWLDNTLASVDRFIDDLVHADGGRDADTGPAALLEMTPEEGARVANEIVEVNQTVGTTVLEGYGLGGLASGINAGVDAAQVAVNRKALRKQYGAWYVDNCDFIAKQVVSMGWPAVLGAIDMLVAKKWAGLRKAAGLHDDFRPVVGNLWPGMSRIYPSLWALEGAPAVPGLGTKLQNARSAGKKDKSDVVPSSS